MIIQIICIFVTAKQLIEDPLPIAIYIWLIKKKKKTLLSFAGVFL